jgi:hypothetical protein
MKNPRTSLATGLIVALMATASVWSGRPAARELATVSTPEITNVTPAAPNRGSKPQRLAISGSDFLQGLTLMITNPGGQSLRFAGADILNRRQGSFEVDAMLDTAGNYSLVVTNTDGGTSKPFVLAVRGSGEQTNRPTIESVTPAKVTKSNTPQILTVRGTRFEAGLVVLLTDPTGTVKTISGNAIADITQTSFQVTAILEIPGEYSIEVKLPSGALSNNSVVVAE